MRENRRYFELSVFFCLTFAGSWLVLLPAVLGITKNNELVIIIATVVPSTVGLLLTYAWGGGAALVGLLKRAWQFRFKYSWYAYSLLLMLFVVAVALVIAQNLVGPVYSSVLIPMLVDAPWALVLIFLYLMILQGPLGEEFGWRGYALDRLIGVCTPFWASIVLGLLWSLWHLPKFLVSGTIQSALVADGLVIGFLGYTFYTVMLTILMTVLHLRTGGSVLAALLMHTAANMSHGLITIMATRSGGAAILAVMLVVTAIVVVYNRDIFFKAKQSGISRAAHKPVQP